jgi:hypothetical protein
LLLNSVARASKGDIYVNYFQQDAHMPGWKPHTSYHASGQLHHKSFNRKLRVDHWQAPDAGFKGQHIAGFGIARRDARVVNKPCVWREFDEVFEIPIAELSTEEYRTHVVIDVMQPGEKPTVTPGAKILRFHVIAERLPQIVITLFETA